MSGRKLQLAAATWHKHALEADIAHADGQLARRRPHRHPRSHTSPKENGARVEGRPHPSRAQQSPSNTPPPPLAAPAEPLRIGLLGKNLRARLGATALTLGCRRPPALQAPTQSARHCCYPRAEALWRHAHRQHHDVRRAHGVLHHVAACSSRKPPPGPHSPPHGRALSEEARARPVPTLGRPLRPARQPIASALSPSVAARRAYALWLVFGEQLPGTQPLPRRYHQPDRTGFACLAGVWSPSAALLQCCGQCKPTCLRTIRRNTLSLLQSQACPARPWHWHLRTRTTIVISPFPCC